MSIFVIFIIKKLIKVYFNNNMGNYSVEFLEFNILFAYANKNM